jgi:putative ABC transport system permease protein
VVKGDGIVEEVRGASVTSAFFEAAKIQPFLGRLFLAEEYQSRGHQVVVLGNRFWRQKLKKDPAWIGKPLNLNERAFTIVGVLPPTFELPSGVELLVPMAAPAN